MKSLASILTFLFLSLPLPAFSQMCEVSVTSPTSAVLAKNGKQRVFLEFTFHERYETVGPAKQREPPYNVCFVLDVSSSMSGQSVKSAKAALVTIMDNLIEDDVFSLVTFNTQATTVIASSEKMKVENAKQIIETIRAGGGTVLRTGVVLGRQCVEVNRRTGAENHLIVISDGESDETTREMRDLGQKYAADGVHVTCIGMGYDNPLLQALAAGNGGDYYFVDQPAVMEILMRQLMGLETYAAMNIDFQILLAPGCTPVRCTHPNPKVQSNPDKTQVVSFSIPYLERGKKYTGILEITVPSTPAKKEKVIARVAANYLDCGEIKTLSAKNDNVPATEPKAEPVAPDATKFSRQDSKFPNHRASAAFELDFLTRPEMKDSSPPDPDYYAECLIRTEMVIYRQIGSLLGNFNRKDALQVCTNAKKQLEQEEKLAYGTKETIQWLLQMNEEITNEIKTSVPVKVTSKSRNQDTAIAAYREGENFVALQNELLDAEWKELYKKRNPKPDETEDDELAQRH